MQNDEDELGKLTKAEDSFPKSKRAKDDLFFPSLNMIPAWHIVLFPGLPEIPRSMIGQALLLGVTQEHSLSRLDLEGKNDTNLPSSELPHYSKYSSEPPHYSRYSSARKASRSVPSKAKEVLGLSRSSSNSSSRHSKDSLWDSYQRPDILNQAVRSIFRN